MITLHTMPATTASTTEARANQFSSKASTVPAATDVVADAETLDPKRSRVPVVVTEVHGEDDSRGLLARTANRLQTTSLLCCPAGVHHSSRR